jgi:hypothetical protein
MRIRLAILILLLSPPINQAVAASKTIGPGQAVGVSENIVLSGEDVLEINGTAERPCRLDANNQQIKTTGDWTGRIIIRHCEFRCMGTAKVPCIDVTAKGDGDAIVIENSMFHSCGAVHIANQGNSATVFRNNLFRETSMVPVTNLPFADSPPIFKATGSSPARKLFQGNEVRRSVVEFENTGNWLIGGDRDEDANLLTGPRGSLSIYTSSNMTVRGNYLHTDIPSFRYSQVHTLLVQSPCPGLVVEHNVIRHGQWVVRGIAGEFRYNLVLDADAHNFIVGPRAHTHIHHNIFARYCTVDPNLNSAISVPYKGEDITIYNNTLDAGGKDLARPWHVPALEVGSDGFVASLRNNAFVRFPTRFSSGSATIRPGFTEKRTLPGPARLGYADYNLFDNPDASEKINYALSVDGKTERADAGFALHDVPAKGTKNEQADPRFKGPVPTKFPFDDDDIRTRKATVSQILARYRDAYSPAAGSPLVGAGDPADGPGSYIGAVGGGDGTPADWFGRPGATPLKK